MKVGILTYHRAENYGALLQSYALSSYLRSQGFEVGFVDYWPDYHKDYFRIFPRKKFATGGLAAKVLSLYWATVWGLPWECPALRNIRATRMSAGSSMRSSMEVTRSGASRTFRPIRGWISGISARPTSKPGKSRMREAPDRYTCPKKRRACSKSIFPILRDCLSASLL